MRHPVGRLSSYAGGNMWELSWDAQPGMGLMCAKISGMENTRTPSNYPASLGRLGSISLQGRSLLRWHLHSDLPGLRWLDLMTAGSAMLCFSTKTHKVRCCVPWKAVPCGQSVCL